MILDHLTSDTLNRINAINIVCRCCGKNLGLERFLDDAFPWRECKNSPIHTRCIPKHWGKHSKGINASRCAEFGSK